MATLIIKITAYYQTDDHFEPVLAWLEGIGLSFQNPVTNTVTSWSTTGQFKTTVEDVIRKIRDFEPGNVQMWYSDSKDLFISWNNIEMMINLDGKNTEDKRRILRCIMDNFIEMSDSLRTAWKICIGIEDVI